MFVFQKKFQNIIFYLKCQSFSLSGLYRKIAKSPKKIAMRLTSKAQNSISSVMIATVPLIFLIPFLNMPFLLIIFLLAIAYATILAFFYPKHVLFMFLILRPMIDIYIDTPLFSAGNIPVKISSMLGVITIFIAAYLFFQKRIYKTLPFQKSIAVFFLILIFGLFSSFAFETSLVEIIRFASVMAFFIMGFALINSGQELKQCMLVIIASAVIPGAVALYQYAVGIGITLPFEGVINRIYGTFVHPNPLAFYLVIPLVLLLFFLLESEKRKLSYAVYCLLAPIFLVVLGLTFTRGAWLALIIALGIIGLYRYRLILLAAGMFGIVLFFTVPSINERVQNLVTADPLSAVSWRINLWKDAWGYVKEKPIVGYGTGTAEAKILEKRGPLFGSTKPHNDFLKIVLENGIVGLFFFLWLLASILLKTLSHYSRARSPHVKTLALFLFSASVGIFVSSFADNMLANTPIQWMYWSMMGAFFAVAGTKVEKRYVV